MKLEYELVQIEGVYCPKGTIDYRGTLESYTWLKDLDKVTKISGESLDYGNSFATGFFDDNTADVLSFTEDNWGFKANPINTGRLSYAHLFIDMTQWANEVCYYVQEVVNNRTMRPPSPTLVTFLTVWSVKTDNDKLSMSLAGFFNAENIPNCLLTVHGYRSHRVRHDVIIRGRLAQIMSSFRRGNEAD